MVATDYFTTRSGNWWPIEVILGGSSCCCTAVARHFLPVLYKANQTHRSLSTQFCFCFRSEPGSATAIEFVRRLVSILRLQVVHSRQAIVIGVPPACCTGTRTSRAVRWRAGTSRLLQRFWYVLLFPRFFRQPKPRKKYTPHLQNLSNVKFIGIGVDFANFSELGKKHLHLLSL